MIEKPAPFAASEAPSASKGVSDDTYTGTCAVWESEVLCGESFCQRSNLDSCSDFDSLRGRADFDCVEVLCVDNYEAVLSAESIRSITVAAAERGYFDFA